MRDYEILNLSLPFRTQSEKYEKVRETLWERASAEGSVTTLNSDPDGLAAEIQCLILKSCCMEPWVIMPILPVLNCCCLWSMTDDQYCCMLTGCGRFTQGIDGRARKKVDAACARNVSLSFTKDFIKWERKAGKAYVKKEWVETRRERKEGRTVRETTECEADRITDIRAAMYVAPLKSIVLDIIPTRELYRTKGHPRPMQVARCVHDCVNQGACPCKWAGVPNTNVLVAYSRDPETGSVHIGNRPAFAIDLGPASDAEQFVKAFYEAQKQAGALEPSSEIGKLAEEMFGTWVAHHDVKQDPSGKVPNPLHATGAPSSASMER